MIIEIKDMPNPERIKKLNIEIDFTESTGEAPKVVCTTDKQNNSKRAEQTDIPPEMLEGSF